MSEKKSKKNDEFSIELRIRGNQLFRKRLWRDAMELYNQSLRYATDASGNVSLAYGNRSAGFFYMRLFEQCLTDIKLVKEANYPQHLMRKLNDREEACLERIPKSTPMETTAIPKLSYGADEELPCLANVLELQNNDEFGKHFVAKNDIQVGEIIILEKMFTFGASSNDRTYCATCLKAIRNFIPYCKCVSAFCNARCLETNDIHKMDCDSSCHFEQRPGDFSIVKTILIAVNAFSSVDDLMKFVEGALVTRDFDSLHGLSDVQLQYGQFLKLLPVLKVLSTELIFQYLTAYNNLFKIGEIQQRFNSKQTTRFLIHLIWHHILIIKSNAYSYRTSVGGYVNAVGNFTALLNHSCTPNVFVTFTGNQQMAITIRPVKKGDQLFREYKNVDKKEFPFECKCSKCIPCYKAEDCVRMKSDPLFKFILRSDHTFFLDDSKFLTLKSKCHAFLTKYGQLPWTKEIEIVSEKFGNCLDHVYLKC